MGQSHVILTFDAEVNNALASLVSRVGYLCPSPLRGKGLVAPTAYHLTAYYGFEAGLDAASLQAWLDIHFRATVNLRFTGLRSHPVGGLACWTVAVESFGLLQLNYWLASHPAALSPTYPVFRPHVTLGFFSPGFDLGAFPPAVCPFGPGGLASSVCASRIDCWFVDGRSKVATALRLSSCSCS